MIEKKFDVPFVAKLAQREKQIQQNYRPVIGVHKWFARRPGSLFRALLLAEWAKDAPLSTSYYESYVNERPLVVGDPFMGGGTPLLEANRLGCHVVGVDINPMAWWIVRQEISELDREAFQAAAQQIFRALEAQIGDLYQTRCGYCGDPGVPVKYFLWVKQQLCSACHRLVDLFPNYVVAKNQRHPNYVLVCASCGALNEVSKLSQLAGVGCHSCGYSLQDNGIARRNRFNCPHCGCLNSYPDAQNGPPSHRLFALEYHCSACKPNHRGRFFKSPDAADLARLSQAERYLQGLSQDYIPQDEIPPGDETTRLHQWGYISYRELFNTRQLLGLQALSAAINAVTDESVRHALLTVFSDTLRYQNMLCRYDSYALKIIDIFSVHGFPVSLIQCENSLLGIPGIGSGGFRHFVEKYDRAKAYCEEPFETYPGRPKRTVTIGGEWIGARLVSEFPHSGNSKAAYLQAISADKLSLPSGSLDAVVTDPPYFANVQYAELMDFCYVWLKHHLANTFPAFGPVSTRSKQELTVNQTEGRDIAHFTAGLSRIFVKFAEALKQSAPFVFTYHHNELEAYLPIVIALLDARLVCTATLPCPAEMGASIHINGTQSSVVDTIFVCRTSGAIRASQFKSTAENLKDMLRSDLEKLQQAGLTPSVGDSRCLLFGHLARLIVWRSRSAWSVDTPFDAKLAYVRKELQAIYPWDLLDRLAAEVLSSVSEVDLLASMRIQDERDEYGVEEDEVSF